MVETEWSKELRMKKVIIYYILFLIVYVLLIVIVSPFLLTWGQERNILEQLCVLILARPFHIESLLFLSLVLNYLFWATIPYLLLLLIKRIKHTLF